jgi:hypothetical protein
MPMLKSMYDSAPQLTGFILLLILVGFLVVVGAAMAVVGRAGLSLLASMQRTQRTVITPAVELMERAQKTAERADALSARSEELQGAMTRLRENVAAMAVLTQTIERTARPWVRATSFLRK